MIETWLSNKTVQYMWKQSTKFLIKLPKLKKKSMFKTYVLKKKYQEKK